MKILAINGSPKGERSNTWQLAKAFIEGLNHAGENELREVAVNQLEIKPCLGCFACWNKTPGSCCLRDDMASVIENMLWADVILWSFPLYYFSVPGPLKNLMDRQLPMVLPFMTADSESGGHPPRFDMRQKRHVVISTCGFYTAVGNYEGVTAMFDHICGKGKYTSVFCGQGELFRVKELHDSTGEYLRYVKDAGWEFAGEGITSATRKKLDTLLFPREVFEAMADASWGVDKTGERAEESLVFTRQMAAMYNKTAWSGQDMILEMDYTDIGKRYQLLLTRDGSQVLSGDKRAFTTRIETPYTLWKSIAAGEISGQDALMQGKYRVTGDFELMIHWDRYFGAGEPTEERSGTSEKPANMNCMLVPWIAYWIGAPIHGFYGALFSMLASAAVPAVFFRNRKTVYDAISGLLVSLFAGMLLLGANIRLVLPLSYLSFGIMWSVSCLCKLPLTAHYSMSDYGGEGSLSNPLFIKTNRILTACWGVLYLLTPIWTWLLMGTSLAPYTGAVNSVLPLAMGLFTAWFQKWYPAKVAAGKI